MNTKKLVLFGTSAVVLAGVLVYALGIYPPASGRDGRGAIGQRDVYRAPQATDASVNPDDAPVATADELAAGPAVTLENGQMVQMNNGLRYQLQDGQMVALQNGVTYHMNNGQMVQMKSGELYSQMNNGEFIHHLNSGEFIHHLNNGQLVALNGMMFKLNNGQMLALKNELRDQMQSDRLRNEMQNK